MAKLIPTFRQPDELSEEEISYFVDLALRRSAEKLELRDALQAHDDQRALRIARQLVGLEQQVRKQ